jgi:hypothetical protein
MDQEHSTAGAIDDQYDEARDLLDDARRRLREVPAEVVVANHVMGLYELAAIHLADTPPDLAQARLAIDAVGCLVDGLGDRLGDDAAVLVESLSTRRTRPSATTTPSARNSDDCSASSPGTSRPAALTTLHQGRSSSLDASTWPTKRARRGSEATSATSP